MAKLIVAMSGGVDSSATAARLKEEGHELIGITLWMQDEPSVPSARSIELAQKTAKKLGIKHELVDAKKDFAERVVQYFAREYAMGRTPNPCVMCNPTIKFSYLIDALKRHEADYIVTGHYAGIVKDELGRSRLIKGADPKRDQSYFLYRLSPEFLKYVQFPLSALEKEHIRAYADKIELPSAHEPDSMDICFVNDDTRIELISKLYPQAQEEGEIVLKDGTVLGKHPGLAHYTVGKRKGLGIAYHEPLYVLEIRAQSNQIVVGPAHELKADQVLVQDTVLHEPINEKEVYLVKFRSRTQAVPATINTFENSSDLIVNFLEPVQALAPGQACVWYRDDMVCGGGTISSSASPLLSPFL